MQPCPPRPAGGRRCTLRRATAALAPPRSCSSAAPSSASRTTTGAPCRPQRRDVRTPDRCRQTPRQLAQECNNLGAYDAAVAKARPPHHSRRTRVLLPLARPSFVPASPCTPSMPHTGMPCVHTGMARHAEAAFFGVRRRIREMICASIVCARSAAAIGRLRAFKRRLHAALRFTMRGRSVHAALRGMLLVTSCEFGLARAPPSVGRGAAGRPAPAGEGRGASLTFRPHARPSSLVRDTSVVAEVLIVRMRALGSFR